MFGLETLGAIGGPVIVQLLKRMIPAALTYVKTKVTGIVSTKIEGRVPSVARPYLHKGVQLAFAYIAAKMGVGYLPVEDGGVAIATATTYAVNEVAGVMIYDTTKKIHDAYAKWRG
jgi:hypothetical protein